MIAKALIPVWSGKGVQLIIYLHTKAEVKKTWILYIHSTYAFKD
jgi:hypothetical protein